MDEKDIEIMINDGVPIEEIAELCCDKYCIRDFGMKNEFCNENVECKDCWIECLNKTLKSRV